MPDPTNPGTAQDGGTPAPAPDAGVTAAPAVQPTSTDDGGKGAEPLLSRLRAAGIPPNDLEQVQRYYGGYDETRGLKKQVSDLGGKDSLRDYADKLMQSFGPEIQDDHANWRATYGDVAYVEAALKQRSQSKGETPDETDDERMARIVKQQVATALKPMREEREQAERWKVFDRDLGKILDGMKLSEGLKEFLRRDIRQNVPEDIADAAALANFAQQRHSGLVGLIASEGKATPTSRPATPQPPPPPGTGSPAPKGGEEKSIRELMRDAAHEAEAMGEHGAGAS